MWQANHSQQRPTETHLPWRVSNFAIAVASVLAIALWPATCHADSKVNRAKLDLMSLKTAIWKYKIDHGKWPNSMKALAEGAPGELPWIEESLLHDPWGHPWNYDLHRVDPKTGIPQIWSEGPEPGAWFANWEENPYWQDAERQRKYWDFFTGPWFLGYVALIAGVVVLLAPPCRAILKGRPVSGTRELFAKAAIVILFSAVGLFLLSLMGPRYMD
jgi:Type II secretion system (T2SS), protein G